MGIIYKSVFFKPGNCLRGPHLALRGAFAQYIHALVGLDFRPQLVPYKHKELILEGNCDKAPGLKIKLTLSAIAECIQLIPSE